MGPSATDVELLERERELGLLLDRLERARQGQGGLVLVEGTAGVGKSALLARLRTEARAAGVRDLQAIGGELEREYPFGLVRQLFEAAVLAASDSERDRLLSGAAARAAPVVGVTAAGEPVEASADASFATLHGLYWLVAALADPEPLLLVLDDAHWADAPSLRFVDFLARRVPELPVLVVLGLRPREPGAEHELIDTLRDAPEVAVLQPSALSVDAVGTLVSSGLSSVAEKDVVASAADATGGNPLLLRELIRTLAEAGVAPTSQAVRDAVPSSVARSVERRLARLPAPSRSVAHAVAVLGERRDADVLAAATGLSVAEVSAALGELRDRDLVVLDPPRFLHPLIRQAVAERVPRADQDRLHVAAAEALRQRRGSEEEAIVHLLATRPTGAAWVVPLLRSSAQRAIAEGAPEAAVRRLVRALEETSAGGSSATELDALHLELGRAAASAGDPSAPDYLALAVESPDPAVAAQATEVQMTVGAFDPAEGFGGIVARLRAAVTRLGPDVDPALHERLFGQLLNVLFVDASLAEERASILAERDVDGAGALSHRAWDAAAGDASAADARSLARRALESRPFSQLAVIEQPTPIWATLGLLVVDGEADADASIADAEATLRRHPTSLGRSMAAFMRAEWLLAYGSAAVAESTAREALELFEAAGNVQSVISSRAALASALVLRGLLDEADAVIAGVPGDDYFDSAWGGGLTWTSRAELRLAQGRPADAVADLRRLGRFVERYGWRRFPRGAHVAMLARALALSGEADAALALAEAEVADARARGAVRLEAEALMALGVALGTGEDGHAALREAREVASRSASLLLRARAAFELGFSLRRGGLRTEAREELAAARELAHRVDATALVERATEELTVAGGRPRRIALSGAEALTASERRVAEHAARGLSNREIAEALFVTRKTVEFQLGKAYGKLGIRSRAQLVGALGHEQPSGEPESQG